MQRKFRWILTMMWVLCSAATAAEPDVFLFDVIKQPVYARTLKSLFDQAGNLPIWTREVRKTKGSYVASAATHATIDGIAYAVFDTCMPHDCPDHQLIIMFAPNGSQAWGALLEEGAISYLGSPSDAQQAVLKKEFD